MAFEQVRVRLTSGQEYGPVPWSMLLQWRQEGRVPDDAALVDAATGEARAVAAFAEIAPQMVPQPVPQAAAPQPDPYAQPQPDPTAQPQAVPYVTSMVPPTPTMSAQGGQWYHGANTPPDASFSTVFDYGWKALGRQYWLAVGGGVIYILIAMAIGGTIGGIAAAISVPFLDTIILGFLMPPLVGGIMRFYLNIYRGTNAQLGDLFSGFTEYPKWLGVYWLLYLVSLLTMVPMLFFGFAGMLPMLMGGRPDPSAMMVLLGQMSAGILISTVFMLIVFSRLAFVYPLVVEGHSVFDAFAVSNRMAHGRMLYIIGMYLLLGLIAAVGVLGCGIGMLFTAPISVMVFCSLYCAIRNEARIEQPMG